MKYSKSFLKSLYKTMLRIRFCEESLVEPILKGEIKCPVHLYTGQEAVATGVCAALWSSDHIFGNHRSHGHYLAQGGSMRELVAEIYGKETGCSRGRGGSMHICNRADGLLVTSPIVAGTISLALGGALVSRIRNDHKVTVSFLGDGATGEGVLYECLNFASLKKLPLIFACENNLYSTHMSIRECRPKEDIFKIGNPFGIVSFKVDGNNVLKVYEIAKKAVKFCREGKGPIFIEFSTYRMRGHVGPDDNIQGGHTDIRPKAEIEKWKERDPIVNFEKKLIKMKKFKREDFEKITQEVDGEVKECHRIAKNSPYPLKEELSKYVFKE